MQISIYFCIYIIGLYRKRTLFELFPFKRTTPWFKPTGHWSLRNVLLTPLKGMNKTQVKQIICFGYN